MKFSITMKDPDAVYEATTEAATEQVNAYPDLSEEEKEGLIESRRDKINDVIREWFEYLEYLTVEIDTDTKTIRVVPN